MKKSIGSDNHSGIHPKIITSIIEANRDHAPSYGTDKETQQMEDYFREIFGHNVETHFVFNGTAANVLCLRSLLQSHESILCAETSHLNRDECGAPEFITGCKLLPLHSPEGKIHPNQIEPCLIRRGDQHSSQVKMLSLTQPTEYGTTYSLEELQKIREICDKHSLFLHIDGTRLIYAANFLDCELKDITTYADAVSFGGTKNGLLVGEAVLLFHPLAKGNFKFLRKQCMQLPSKMRFISAQFRELLSPKEMPLWKEIAQNGHKMAIDLSRKIEEFPEIKLTQKVHSNVVFATIPKEWLKNLRKNFFFYVWDESTWEVRWMFSFDSTQDDVNNFIEDIRQVRKIKKKR